MRSSRAERYLAAVLQESQYATLTGSVRGQAITRAGTLSREAFRHLGQFKSFAVNLYILQIERIIREFVANGFWRGAQHALGVAIAATLAGAMVEQIKQILAGKDPRDMTTGEFLGRGGLSIRWALDLV